MNIIVIKNDTIDMTISNIVNNSINVIENNECGQHTKYIKKLILNNYGHARYMDEVSFITELEESLLYYKNIIIEEYCLVQIFFSDNLNLNRIVKNINFKDKLFLIIKVIKYKLSTDNNNGNNGNILLSIFENISLRLNTI
jgi:hypothetical protein